ncbi:MAG: hypothetical protein NC311_16305, partial [Muribaculaceae bacterium]|nr:hypothetical protein [Muribaculaceae bacterium]
MDGHLVIPSLDSAVEILVNVDDPEQYDVPLNVRLDDKNWTDSDRKLFLKSSYITVPLTQNANDGMGNSYVALNVPEGTYSVWEYQETATDVGYDAVNHLIRNTSLCLEGPLKITVRDGVITTNNDIPSDVALDYYTMNADILPEYGVASASLDVSYARLTKNDEGEDVYLPNAASEWTKLKNKPVMKDAPLYIVANGVACEGFFGSLFRTYWRAMPGAANNGLADIPGTSTGNQGPRVIKVAKATGKVNLHVVMNGGVAEDNNRVSYMAVQLVKNDINWSTAYAQGYRVYAESVLGRNNSEVDKDQSWASYELTSQGGGVFDTKGVGNIPNDVYMIYIGYPNGVKIPVVTSYFSLTSRGYVYGISSQPIVPDAAKGTALRIDMREIEYTIEAGNTAAGMTSNTAVDVQIINGFNRNLQYYDRVNDTYVSANGWNEKGLILVEPDQPAPNYNVTVVETIHVEASGSKDGQKMGSIILPRDNDVSVQIVGSGASAFMISVSATTEDAAPGTYDNFDMVQADPIPLGYPMTFSTDTAHHMNFYGGSYTHIPTDADYPINQGGNVHPDPWMLSEGTAFYVNIYGQGDPVGGNGFAELSSVYTGPVETVAELVADYDAYGVTVNAASLFANTGSGAVVETEAIVPGRELPNWTDKDVKMDELALGSYIELIEGDTVDVVGTIETYIPDYRLRYTPTQQRFFLNSTTKLVDGQAMGQLYLTKPDKNIKVGETVDGKDILAPNPERYAEIVEEKILDSNGNETGETVQVGVDDLWVWNGQEDFDLTLTSSDPEVVRVDGYTLIAGAKNGTATVRVYNPATQHSAMITVHVLNVVNATGKDENGQPRAMDYAYKATPAIALGDNFSVALKADGTVWTWGDNTYGQLGINEERDVTPYASAPQAVVTVSDTGAATAIRHVVAIAAGARHAVALTREGVVYVWGDNTFGQLGLDPADFEIIEADAMGEPQVVAHISYSAVEAKIKDGDKDVILGKVVEVAAGNGFTVARTERNTVWAWGRNDKGQLGIGYTGDVFGFDAVRKRNEEVVVDVGTADVSGLFGKLIMILFQDGGTLTTDEVSALVNRFTQGADPAYTIGEPYYLDSYYIYAKYLYDLTEFVRMQRDNLVDTSGIENLYKDGKLVSPLDEYRGNEMRTQRQYVLAMELYEAAVNYLYTAHLDMCEANAGYKSQGSSTFVPLINDLGKTGMSPGDLYNLDWTLAKPSFGGVKWSYEDYEDALAKYDERIENKSWVGSKGEYVNKGGDPECYEGEPTFFYQPGEALGTREYTWIPSQVLEGAAASKGYYLSEIMAISAGDSHVMALRSDGSLFGWGDNTYGQLGVGVDSVLNATAQVSDDSGVGATFTYRVPVRVRRGDIVSTNSPALEVPPLTSGGERMGEYLVNVMSVAAGGDHTLALLSDGTVVSFGKNTYGQLGDDRVGKGSYDVEASSDVAPDEAAKATARVKYDISKLVVVDETNPDDDRESVDAYDLLKDAITESRVAQPTMVRREDGSLLRYVRAIAAGGNSSEAIVKDPADAALANQTGGTIYAWGSNMEG